MKVMRKELMDYDRELYELSDAIKRVNFDDLDAKGGLRFQRSDSFKRLKQEVSELYESVDSELIEESLISEKIDLVRKALKDHSKKYRNIVGDINGISVKELEFLLTFKFLIVTRRFTGNQLIKIINSQPLNIQQLFQGDSIWTLSEFKDDIFYKEGLKLGTDIHNTPTYTMSNYDFFIGHLRRLIERKYEEILKM